MLLPRRIAEVGGSSQGSLFDNGAQKEINYSMGAASAAANPLRNLSVGGERNSKPQGVCTIAPLLLKPSTLNGLPNSLGCQQHVTRP